MTDPVNYPSPCRCILYAGEIANNYLKLDKTDKTACVKTGIKIASYVLTLGVLPAIALLISYIHHRVTRNYFEQLNSIAAQSLPGAIWVCKNIQRFRCQ